MIYIPKICGVCMGSRTAIDLAIKLANEYSNVVIYKEILHNKTVIDYLKENNVKCVLSLDEIKNNMTVVIVTHNSAIKDMADKVIHFKNGTVTKIEINKNPTPIEMIEW